MSNNQDEQITPVEPADENRRTEDFQKLSDGPTEADNSVHDSEPVEGVTTSQNGAEEPGEGVQGEQVKSKRETAHPVSTWWQTEPARARQFTIPSLVFVLAFFLVIIGAATTLALIIPDGSRPKNGPEQSIAYPAPVEDVVYQCGDIFNFYPSERHYGVIPANVVFTEDRDIPLVPTRIQAYGYMSENAWTGHEQRFFTEDDDMVPTNPKLLRGMWQGYHVIWYKPGNVTETALAELEQMTKESSRVIVTPWNSNSDMPLNRNYSFATWNMSQSCNDWNLSTAQAFTGLEDPKERDRAKPPMAPLNDEGQLFEIPRFGSARVITEGFEVPEISKDESYYE